MIKFLVITKASHDPTDKAGNWANSWAVYNEEEKTLFIDASADQVEKDKIILPPLTNALLKINNRYFKVEDVMISVFEEGEILIVDESGREVAGLRRKPSKWYVEYEEFEDLEKAIERAKEVIRGE